MFRRQSNESEEQKLEDLKNLPAQLIRRELGRWRLMAWVMGTATLLGSLLIVYYAVIQLQEKELIDLIIESFVYGIAIIILFSVMIIGIANRQRRLILLLEEAIEDEFGQLRKSIKRGRSLQEMATTLRATLNSNKVLDAALDVCIDGMEEMGISEKDIAAAVLLFEGDELAVVSERRFLVERNRSTIREAGVISRALTEAEPVISTDPANDAGLTQFRVLRRCPIVVCLPLRVGFQLFGVIIIGSQTKVRFTKPDMDLFLGVADQVVIALQNAQLYQNLEQEKQRLIESEAEARKELARALHDGPTQSVSAIAMRINFIRSIMGINSDQAMKELGDIEKLAQQTAREIRGMLFTLRPLVLETQGLAAAVEQVLNRIEEDTDIQTRLIGGEYTDMLNLKAQGVLFYIIEEAANNAKKYSQASGLEVRFWNEGNLFAVRVQDNGIGFDVNDVMTDYESRGSLGMVNMRERAQMIDGSVKLQSTPGRGTAITVVVPLDKQGVKTH